MIVNAHQEWDKHPDLFVRIITLTLWINVIKVLAYKSTTKRKKFYEIDTRGMVGTLEFVKNIFGASRRRVFVVKRRLQKRLFNSP
jgi:hypothetical protein